MNHMERFLIRKCFHARSILSICPEHLEQNFLLEPCPHKIYTQSDARDKLRLGVAPEKNNKKEVLLEVKEKGSFRQKEIAIILSA